MVLLGGVGRCSIGQDCLEKLAYLRRAGEAPAGLLKKCTEGRFNEPIEICLRFPYVHDMKDVSLKPSGMTDAPQRVAAAGLVEPQPRLLVGRNGVGLGGGLTTWTATGMTECPCWASVLTTRHLLA